jgi:hypothetical protein
MNFQTCDELLVPVHIFLPLSCFLMRNKDILIFLEKLCLFDLP